VWNIYNVGVEAALLPDSDRAHRVLLGVLCVGTRRMDSFEHYSYRSGQIRLLALCRREWRQSRHEVSLPNILLLTQENKGFYIIHELN
jgi:hypothetical protein